METLCFLTSVNMTKREKKNTISCGGTYQKDGDSWLNQNVHQQLHVHQTHLLCHVCNKTANDMFERKKSRKMKLRTPIVRLMTKNNQFI